MKFLKKKPDPPQQHAPPPTAQRSSQPPPPLFARFASSNSPGPSSSTPLISGPAPLAPRNSVHKQSRPHDGSPPKSTNPRVAAPLVQRNRMLPDEQQPISGGRDDKPLPDPTQRMDPYAFRRGQVQPFEPRSPPLNPSNANGLLPGPKKFIPEFGKRDDPWRNAEFAPASLDAPSALAKFEDTAHRLGRTPISSSPERRPPPKSAPVPEPQPSSLLGFQSPSDRPHPRRKYSPLEAFGLVSGENSPAPSATTSSVNLPSQNSVSTPPTLLFYRTTTIAPCHHGSAPQMMDTKLTTTTQQHPPVPSESTNSSDSLPSLPGEVRSAPPDLDTVSNLKDVNLIVFKVSARPPQGITTPAVRVYLLERQARTSPI